MIQKEIRCWLRDFAANIASRDAAVLANEVVMLHIAVWPDKPEIELYEFEVWLRTHQGLYARGIIRALKRHRKWAGVKRILVKNQDPLRGGIIATEEYYPHLLRVIRKYG